MLCSYLKRSDGRKKYKQKKLSDKASINRHTFNRKLMTEEFTFSELRRLYEAAGINWHCAILAIECENDWRLYNSTTIEVASTLAEMISAKIHHVIERDIQPVKHAALTALTEEIAIRIAKHDDTMILRFANI